MTCTPQKGHPVVYWYQQIPKKEFKFLISFQNDDIIDLIELFKERFSANCPKTSPCSLEIRSPELGDSAVYFCASSQATVLRWQLLAVHKRILDTAQEAAGALSCDGRQLEFA